MKKNLFINLTLSNTKLTILNQVYIAASKRTGVSRWAGELQLNSLEGYLTYRLYPPFLELLQHNVYKPRPNDKNDLKTQHILHIKVSLLEQRNTK